MMKDFSDKFVQQLTKKIKQCGPFYIKGLGDFKIKVTTNFPPRLIKQFDGNYDLVVKCKKIENGEIRFVGIGVDNTILQLNDLSNIKLKIEDLHCRLYDIGEECLDAV